MRKAAGRGEKDIVQELLRRGCNPNCTDGNGFTTLHHASQYGCVEIIRVSIAYVATGGMAGQLAALVHRSIPMVVLIYVCPPVGVGRSF